MVSWLFGSIALVAVAAALALAVFLIAVVRGWFAALANGFLVALVVAFVSLGVFAVWLSGTWGYRAARRVVTEQVELDLRNIGDIVERQIQDELEEAFQQIEHLASELPADYLTKRSEAAIEDDLQELAHINTRFLQLDIVDMARRRLGTSTLAAKAEPLPRDGIGSCLDGHRYASEPYWSNAFARPGHDEYEHVIDLCVSVEAHGAPIGALAARFDLEDSLI